MKKVIIRKKWMQGKYDKEDIRKYSQKNIKREKSKKKWIGKKIGKVRQGKLRKIREKDE